MASEIKRKIKEIENTQFKSGELFMYGHCDENGEINAGICCEEADLEAIESTLQYIMMQTARVLYDSNPDITKENITEIMFTDLFGSINLFLGELDHGKSEDELREEAADLITDCFEEFDFFS